MLREINHKERQEKNEPQGAQKRILLIAAQGRVADLLMLRRKKF